MFNRVLKAVFFKCWIFKEVNVRPNYCIINKYAIKLNIIFHKLLSRCKHTYIHAYIYSKLVEFLII